VVRLDADDAAHRGPTGAPRTVRIVDNVVSVVLFLIQVGLWPVAYISYIAIPMSTDSCAYVECGDDKWIDYAMATVALSAPVGAICIGVGIYLLAKRKTAFWSPLLGAGAQVAMIAAAWMMAGHAGQIG
jgi:hypothetical protein